MGWDGGGEGGGGKLGEGGRGRGGLSCCHSREEDREGSPSIAQINRSVSLQPTSPSCTDSSLRAAASKMRSFAVVLLLGLLYDTCAECKH